MTNWRYSRARFIPRSTGLNIRDWIASEWGESENNRKAKFYKLTAAGRKKLQSETDNWNRMADVMASILKRKPEGA